MNWLLLIMIWLFCACAGMGFYLLGARIGYNRAVDEFNEAIQDAIQKGVSHGDSQQQPG